LRSDRFKHTGQILRNVGIPKAQHRHAAVLKPARPLQIGVHSNLLCVLTTVEFDCEAQRGRVKIEKGVAGGMLPSKIHTKLAIAQSLPEQHLNIGAVAAKMASAFGFQPGPVEA
jgi:hypothetical protein